MKTEIIHINSNGDGVKKALLVTEDCGVKQGLSGQDTKRLRLLTEETLELLRSITGQSEADYSADIDDERCEIRLIIKPASPSIDRVKLMSMPSVSESIVKKMALLFEIPFSELQENEEAIKEIGVQRLDDSLLSEMGRSGNGYVWSLDSYEMSTFDSHSPALSENWEEISRSIIAALSDEIRIYIFKDSSELVIIKRFEKQSSSAGEYAIHPDFEELKRIPVAKSRFQVRLVQLMYGRRMQKEKSGMMFTVEKIRIPSKASPEGRINSLLYSSRIPEETEAAPCILFIHGGAFLFPALPYHYRFARLMADMLPCRVVMPMYHLAPDRVPPLQQEEIYDVYTELRDNASKYNIDPDRIIVAGDSAGGTLAAALCLMARDRGIASPLAQALFYPSLDIRLESDSMKKYPDVPVCNADAIKVYYSLCRPGEYHGSNDYRSPLEAASLEGLPEAFIETAEFDSLHDDGIAYAKRLMKAGVEVTLNETKGTVHAFEMAKDSSITKEALNRRIQFMKRIIGGASDPLQ
ncbi:MAG: alpha/beta hydrolase [Lachnospiraceae bacterium]|nr:alpha/beta hydrolase [Lachnospiraceae bacterium]